MCAQVRVFYLVGTGLLGLSVGSVVKSTDWKYRYDLDAELLNWASEAPDYHEILLLYKPIKQGERVRKREKANKTYMYGYVSYLYGS